MKKQNKDQKQDLDTKKQEKAPKPENSQNKKQKKIRKLPPRKKAIQIMRKLGLPRNIIKHELAVMREANELIHNIKKNFPVDLKLVKIGAIFHDIGRLKTHGFKHGLAGGDMIREMGYPEELARIIERHVMAGLRPQDIIKFELPDRNLTPETLEEKIVCLADKYYIGTKRVTINGRFQRWIDRFGETEFLLAQRAQAQALEEEILKLIFT
jgi:uncharacterized protein